MVTLDYGHRYDTTRSKTKYNPPPSAQKAEGSPLSWDQHPTTPLDAETTARFEGLTWIDPQAKKKEFPQPSFGIERIKIGDPDKVTLITQDEDGNLVKRVVSQKNESIEGLGGGPYSSGEDEKRRTVYTNDNSVFYGPGSFWQDRRLVFQEGVDFNAESIQKGIEVAEEFLVAKEQDAASRKIKQAEKDLISNLSFVGQDPKVMVLVKEKLAEKMREAAIESGLIKDSRVELPEKIRQLADKMDEVGVKVVDLRGQWGVAFWPDGIRKSWTPETDSYTWKEWAGSENPPIAEKEQVA